MGFRVLGEAVMLAHFGFLAFLTVGGFLAWRWPRLIVAHLATAAWGLISVVVGLECPLTAWEDALRRLAGAQGLERGFIDTYLTGVVYPAEHLVTVQVLVAATVLVSWCGFALRHRSGRTQPSR